MILHVPWRDIDDLKNSDQSWEDVYNLYCVVDKTDINSQLGDLVEPEEEYEEDHLNSDADGEEE